MGKSISLRNQSEQRFFRIMTMTIHALSSTESNAAIDVLREAIAEGFEDVIIIGRKGDEITISGTATEDRMKMIGAIEMAKYELLND